MQVAKEHIYKQFFKDFESTMNARNKTYLDQILTEEINKDMARREWETDPSAPILKNMRDDRIK